MESHLLETPVLFLVFNRPSPTKIVFEAIRAARPARLFIAADGPRASKPDEAARCEEVRKIVTAVDWDCEVQTLFREKNFGCALGVSDAISWFFSHVEEGIILEDDCLPSQDFFRFCAELLVRYRYDTRVTQIGGNNMKATQFGAGSDSYFFSNHNFIWGWASWRRVWKSYDYRMNHYQEVVEKKYFRGYFKSFDEEDFYDYVWGQTMQNPGSWDYQLQFSRMLQAGVAIVPWKNLIVNIGYGDDATHTQGRHILPDQELEPLTFPLRHPEFIMVNRTLDSQMFNGALTTPWSRIKQRIKHVLPSPLLELKNRITR